jgi:hypothetical protein
MMSSGMTPVETTPVQDKPEDLSVKREPPPPLLSALTPPPLTPIRPVAAAAATNGIGGGGGMGGASGGMRKVKPIPPPLNLNARTLGVGSNGQSPPLRVPKSPGDMPRECLPIRKRCVIRW